MNEKGGDMFRKLIDRRDFIRSSVAGCSGFFFLASNDKKQEEKSSEKKRVETKKIYRTLGKTGIKLPVITMGVMNSDNPALVRAALDAGMVHLDTA
jgi:hypothetical protein